MEEKNNNQFYKKKKTLAPVENWKALVIFLFGLIGLSFVAIPVQVILKLIYQYDDNSLPELLYKVESLLNFFTYFISLVALLAFIGIPSIKQIFSKIKEWELYEKGIIFGIILIAVQTVLSVTLTLIFGTFEENTNQNSLISITKTTPVLAFFFTVIFGPIFEELVYRYALFGSFHKKSRLLAYVVVAIVFGFIHFDFSALSNENELLYKELINLPSYIAGGLVLCYAYEKDESLIPAIIAHMINNFVGFTQILMYQ